VDVLFTSKDMRGYLLFEFRVLKGSEREDISVNNKYPLPLK